MLTIPRLPLLLLTVPRRRWKLRVGSGASPIVRTPVWWTRMGFLLWRKWYHVRGRPELRSVMVVRRAVWWRVSLERMKSSCTGQVAARELVLASKSGCNGIWFITIACYARIVINSGSEFELREGGPLRFMKWLSYALLSSCAESFNCRWNNSSIPRRTYLFVACGFCDLYVFCGGMLCSSLFEFGFLAGGMKFGTTPLLKLIRPCRWESI